MTLSSRFKVFSLIAGGVFMGQIALSQPGDRGMPPEARNQIHTLFQGHSKIRRTVSETKEGYVALTESDDPKVASALKKHVKQMRDRLDSGLRVRRWDPAFEEYVKHYHHMTHEFEETRKGVRITVKGTTSVASQVARNHAKVITAFVTHGWAEHDRKHAAVSP